VETPILSQHESAQAQDALPKSWRASVIPPLPERKEESFPLLSYWHQRFAPEKVLNGEIAEFYLQKLDASRFSGNVTTIVDLARQLTQRKAG
jgi:DNA-binding NtrC family response regulator